MLVEIFIVALLFRLWESILTFWWWLTSVWRCQGEGWCSWWCGILSCWKVRFLVPCYRMGELSVWRAWLASHTLTRPWVTDKYGENLLNTMHFCAYSTFRTSSPLDRPVKRIVMVESVIYSLPCCRISHYFRVRTNRFILLWAERKLAFSEFGWRERLWVEGHAPFLTNYYTHTCLHHLAACLETLSLLRSDLSLKLCPQFYKSKLSSVPENPLDRPVKRVVTVESVIYAGIVIRENYIIFLFQVSPLRPQGYLLYDNIMYIVDLKGAICSCTCYL